MQRSETPISKGPTALSAIAAHERQLLDQLEQGKREARQRVEQARLEAANRHSQAERDLANEVSAMKQEAHEACERERAALLAQTRQQIEGEVAAAQSRVDESVRNLVAMVLPRGATVR